MFNQEAKVEQMHSQTKSATEILTNFRHFNERGQASFPAEFPKELELAVIAAVLQTPAAHRMNGPDADPKIMIDLDRNIGDKITKLFYAGRRRYEYGYNGNHTVCLTDFVMINCGLWKTLENLYFNHRTTRLYHTENPDRSIDYKIELIIPHNNILELLENRLIHWADIETAERNAKEMHELYVWMKEQKEDDTSKKILSIVTEIGTDVKMVIGFAKDLMGELVSIKTKLAAIGKRKAKTNGNKTV